LVWGISMTTYSARPEALEGRALTLREPQGERGPVRWNSLVRKCSGSPSWSWVVSLVIAASSLHCGYHFIGTQTSLPAGVHSVSVGAIENRSRQFGLDKTLAFAFEREVSRRGLLRLEEQPNAGDAVLSGKIRAFQTRPVAFDAQDEAIEYQAELIVDLTLRRQSDGTVLWEASGLQEIEEYAVQVDIVVPSTSQFQQGTLNLEDLQQLTDIQLAETEKRLAIERLVEAVVRDAHDRMLEDF